MKSKVARMMLVAVTAITAVQITGCSSAPDLRSVSRPPESKRQYLGIKKIAVMPMNNIGGNKGAEDQLTTLLMPELNLVGTFEEIEDPRYVANVLKALKIRKLDSLDLETVRKMGSEMRAQALLLGDINAWGYGEGADAAMHISLTFTLLDTNTGKPLWIGSGTERRSFTWSRAFGLDEGPTDIEVARDLIISLLRSMDKEIEDRREDELARIKAEEAAKLKAAAEAEKRRLEEQMKEEE